MNLQEILKGAVEKEASDIFIIAAQPVSYKINGMIEKQDDIVLYREEIELLIDEMYAYAGNRDVHLRKDGDDDFALSVPNVGRFRVNVYQQRGSWSAVLRVVSFDLPDVSFMNIPDTVLELSKKHEFKDATTFELLSNPKEIDLIKYIGEFPSVVSDAAKTFSPYKITNYVQKLAQLFHTFYNECKVIDSTNEELSSQRLALVKASKIVIRNALNLVGVSAPNKM